jgi:hypothetical protein
LSATDYESSYEEKQSPTDHLELFALVWSATVAAINIALTYTVKNAKCPLKDETFDDDMLYTTTTLSVLVVLGFRSCSPIAR